MQLKLMISRVIIARMMANCLFSNFHLEMKFEKSRQVRNTRRIMRMIHNITLPQDYLKANKQKHVLAIGYGWRIIIKEGHILNASRCTRCWERSDKLHLCLFHQFAGSRCRHFNSCCIWNSLDWGIWNWQIINSFGNKIIAWSKLFRN